MRSSSRRSFGADSPILGQGPQAATGEEERGPPERVWNLHKGVYLEEKMLRAASPCGDLPAISAPYNRPAIGLHEFVPEAQLSEGQALPETLQKGSLVPGAQPQDPVFYLAEGGDPMSHNKAPWALERSPTQGRGIHNRALDESNGKSELLWRLWLAQHTGAASNIARACFQGPITVADGDRDQHTAFDDTVSMAPLAGSLAAWGSRIGTS
ncbi:hypothetical protein F66182_8836 [Fusarium sp. NRRL 66182]|nr:hypothetical protein F66182_8836 [Fusarium sp. NRRL 66182]